MSRVSVIIVPRERFSCAAESMRSIVTNTPNATEFLCVDAGSAPDIAAELSDLAAAHDVQLIRTEAMLSPNQARNAGLLRCDDLEYVVFIDNDVLVDAGWLEALLKCAEETGAAAVGPLYLVDENPDPKVHMAGGYFEIEERAGERFLREAHEHAERPLSEVAATLRRTRCDYAEFHCMLVRRSALDEAGGLDEGLLSAPEHVDLSLSLREIGHETWFEPDAHVTYLQQRPYEVGDLDYFDLRWSPDWTERSFAHFAQKWSLSRHSGMLVKEATWISRYRRSVLPQRPANWHQSVAAEREPPAAPAADPGADLGTGLGADLGAGAMEHRASVSSKGLAHLRQLGTRVAAQSVTQLMGQLLGAGYESRELSLVYRCYQLAHGLLPRLVHPSGKPYLNHLVGVASVLAGHGAAARVVAAGMISDIYLHGRFSNQGTGPAAEQRAYICSSLGDAMEQYVHACYRATLDTAFESRIHEQGSRGSVSCGIVAAIRLAAAIETRLDFAGVFLGDSGGIASPGAVQAIMARIKLPGLFETYLTAHAAAAEAVIPAGIIAHRKSPYRIE